MSNPSKQSVRLSWGSKRVSAVGGRHRGDRSVCLLNNIIEWLMHFIQLAA